MKKLAIIIVSVMTALASFGPAHAFPTTAISPSAQTSSDVQQVRYDDFRRHGGRHGRSGWRNGNRHDYRHNGYRRYGRHHGGNAGAIIGGLAAGAIIGGVLSQQSNGSGSCASRYRSYRASDNTYQPYNGPRRQCR